jgi:hypothetical protein
VDSPSEKVGIDAFEANVTLAVAVFLTPTGVRWLMHPRLAPLLDVLSTLQPVGIALTVSSIDESDDAFAAAGSIPKPSKQDAATTAATQFHPRDRCRTTPI